MPCAINLRAARRLAWLLLGLLAAPSVLAQTTQPQPLTFEALYGEKPLDVSGKTPRILGWLPDGEHYLERRDGVVMQVNTLSGEASPAYDVDALQAALRQVAGDAEVKDEDLQRAARNDPEFSEDRSVALIEWSGSVYAWRPGDPALQKLFDATATELRTLSPDNRWVSFVKNGDLYVVPTTGNQPPRRLTRGGSDDLLHGKLDWVYQEELYGRGNYQAHWWSEDGRYLAFVQLDQTSVPLHTIIHHSDRPQRLEKMRYPHAGKPNSLVKLAFIDVTNPGDTPHFVNLDRYAGQDILIVRVGWSPRHQLWFQVQDRTQRWLELCAANLQTGASTVLLKETSPAWVDILDEPKFLENGDFLWRSARDGWRHLYRYSPDGAAAKQLTHGAGDVREVYGVDEKKGIVYFAGSLDSPIEPHVYQVALGGGELQRLTAPGLSHSANFDPTFRYFVDTASALITPPTVTLRRSTGEPLRDLGAAEVPALQSFQLGATELLRVPIAGSEEAMNALLIKPPGFDPAKKYPVLCQVYGGPGAPTVSNSYRGGRFFFDQLLASEGYLIWYCDPRSASDHGAASSYRAYKRLGQVELEDIHAGLDWLVAQRYADPERVAIMGGSYGGYLVCYALTHSDRFRAGISAYPVTDWREYDSIYTERYMGLPKDNLLEYDQSSCIAAAERLTGRLLIYHGLIDENVHVHNTLQFMDALQRKGIVFETMMYPRDRHGIGSVRNHERRVILDFLKRWL